MVISRRQLDMQVCNLGEKSGLDICFKQMIIEAMGIRKN